MNYLGKYTNSLLIPSLSIKNSENMIDILYVYSIIGRLTELVYHSPSNILNFDSNKVELHPGIRLEEFIIETSNTYIRD